MKYSEIKSLSTKELVETYKQEKLQYQKMKFQNSVSQVEGQHKMKLGRKTIARLLTEMNNRRFDAEMAAFEKMINNQENN